MMQTVNINIDRVALLKEETGQYFTGARRPTALVVQCDSLHAQASVRR